MPELDHKKPSDVDSRARGKRLPYVEGHQG